MAKRIYDADPYLSSEFEASRALHRASRPNGPDCEQLGRSRYGRAWHASPYATSASNRRLRPRLARLDLNAAEAAACPPDYVAAPLLSAVSTLVGHARWAQATAGWTEPHTYGLGSRRFWQRKEPWC